jgi:hypothetical protein
MEKQPIEVVAANDDALPPQPPEQLSEEDGMALAEVHSTYLQLENNVLKMQLQLAEAIKQYEKTAEQFKNALGAVRTKYSLSEKDPINPVTRKFQRAS